MKSQPFTTSGSRGAVANLWVSRITTGHARSYVVVLHSRPEAHPSKAMRVTFSQRGAPHAERQWHKCSQSGGRFCFRCGESSHLSFNCRNIVVCFIYRKLGHRAISCPNHQAGEGRSLLAFLQHSSAMAGDFLEIPYDNEVAEEVWHLCNHAVAILTISYALPAEVSAWLHDRWERD